MAFPTTLAGWIAYVRDWIGADEYTDAQIQQFLDLGNSRLNVDLSSFPMEKLFHRTILAPDYGEPIDLTLTISDFNKIRLVSIQGFGTLDVATVNEYIDKVNETPSGGPYTRGVYNIDAGNLYLWPWPGVDSVVDIHYYEMVPGLSLALDSNTFSTKHPDLFLYAACLEAAPYMVEDDRVAVWTSKYTTGVVIANDASNKIKLGSTPLKREFRTLNYGTSRPLFPTGSAMPPVPDVVVPSNATPPLISPTAAIVGDTLSCTTGLWSTLPSSYEYQWMNNGVNIAGATSSTYTTSGLDNGAVVNCKVRATNTVGTSVYVTSSNACLVSAPVITGSNYFPNRYFPTSYFGDRYFG